MVVTAYMSLVATSSAHLSSALLMQPEDTREDDSMRESESVEECCDDRGKLKCGLVNDKGDQPPIKKKDIDDASDGSKTSIRNVPEDLMVDIVRRLDIRYGIHTTIVRHPWRTLCLQASLDQDDRSMKHAIQDRCM